MNTTLDIPTNGTDTSNAAAKSMEPHLERCERMVMDCVRGWGDDGLTTDMIEMMTGLPHQNCSARVYSLVKRGLLRDTGQRRPTRTGRMARVYVCA